MSLGGYHGNRGEMPRQGDGLDDLEQFLDVHLDNWYQQQSKVYRDTMRYIRDQLAHKRDIDELERLVREALGPKPPSSITYPSEIMLRSLESILEKSSKWGLNIDVDGIRIQYYVAGKEDRKMIDSLVKNREQSSQSEQVQATDKIHVSKMRAQEGGTNEPIEIEVFTLDEIQNEISYHNVSNEEMENPPDVWYSEAGHRLTQKGLKWHLAQDGWSFDGNPECNHLYFVDIDPYYDENGDHTYMVALLHHLIEGDEQDEPVPIEWKVCQDVNKCNNLDTHLRHQPSTKNVKFFLARDMCKDSIKYIGPKDDDRLHPDIVQCSTELLSMEHWTTTFARQQNDLYLGCRYAPKEATRTVAIASTSGTVTPLATPPFSIPSKSNASTSGSSRISKILKSAKDRSSPNNSSQSLFKMVASKVAPNPPASSLHS